ncbi:hypothetical protein [Haloplanus halophilus]|uniref:hypothetical protein n=1 Tax=Haloplanus halophilus TaxID=2949993 RepID=UPI002040BC0F|nr:hypothetical protein [Haloplanus sp. GDY1]
MSNSSPTAPIDRLPRLQELAEAWPLRRSLEVLTAPLRFVAFWAAVALPFLYLPLLVGGLEGQQATVFAGLLLANVAALVLGHEHGR